jgi:hypothetical protein
MDRRLHLCLDREGPILWPPFVDLFPGHVVGWSMSTAMTAQIVTDALVMEICDGQERIPQRTVPAADGRSQRHLFDEPVGQCLEQHRDGDILLDIED